MAILPSAMAYFDGPNDGAAMRSYLNQVIRSLNALVQFVVSTATGSGPGVVTANYVLKPTDNLVLVNSAGGGFSVQYPIGYGSPQNLHPVIVMKVSGDANVVSLQDQNGNEKGVLVSANQGIALMTSDGTTLSVGGVQ